jgi:hypothetical protein
MGSSGKQPTLTTIYFYYCLGKFVAYADDDDILGGSVHAVKKNTEALVAATKETGLEVNANKTKYMVMSRDQNARQNHSIKTDNSSFERVEEFQKFGNNFNGSKFYSGRS